MLLQKGFKHIVYNTIRVVSIWNSKLSINKKYSKLKSCMQSRSSDINQLLKKNVLCFFWFLMVKSIKCKMVIMQILWIKNQISWSKVVPLKFNYFTHSAFLYKKTSKILKKCKNFYRTKPQKSARSLSLLFEPYRGLYLV